MRVLLLALFLTLQLQAAQLITPVNGVLQVPKTGRVQIDVSTKYIVSPQNKRKTYNGSSAVLKEGAYFLFDSVSKNISSVELEVTEVYNTTLVIEALGAGEGNLYAVDAQGIASFIPYTRTGYYFTVTVTKPGTYYFVFADKTGFVIKTGVYQFKEPEFPTLVATREIYDAYVGYEYGFGVELIGGEALCYVNWGECDEVVTSNFIRHTFTTAGTYTIILMATDVEGFTSYEGYNITVRSRACLNVTAVTNATFTITNTGDLDSTAGEVSVIYSGLFTTLPTPVVKAGESVTLIHGVAGKPFIILR